MTFLVDIVTIEKNEQRPLPPTFMTGFIVADPEANFSDSELETQETTTPSSESSKFDEIATPTKKVLAELLYTTPDRSNNPGIEVVRRSDVCYLVNMLAQAMLEDRQFNKLVSLVGKANPDLKMTFEAASSHNYLFPKAALEVIKAAVNNPDLVGEAIELADADKIARDRQLHSKAQSAFNIYFGEKRELDIDSIFA